MNIPGFKGTDRAGRVERAALERVQRSTDAIWFCNPHSFIPVRVQLLVLRLWFFLRGLFV